MKYIFIIALTLFSPLSAAQNADPSATTLRILLSSTDKIDNIGFHLADKKGLFKAENIVVNLMTPQTQDPLNRLEYGEVDIAMETLPSALQKNQKTANLCLLKQIDNSPGIVLVSQSPNFTTLNQAEGQTLFHASTSDYLAARIWLSTEGLSVKGEKALVKFRRYDSILRDFTTGKISHAIVPESWLPMLYNKIAGNLNVFRPAFVKGATLGTGLYVTRKKYETPAFQEIMTRFLKAMDEGFKSAFAQKKQALDLVLTPKEKQYPDEVLMKRLQILETAYTAQDSFFKHYEHSLQNIMGVEEVSEIKEYPRKDFLVLQERAPPAADAATG